MQPSRPSHRVRLAAAVAIAAVCGAGGSTARAGDYFVDPQGGARPNTYTTIQAAITAVSGQTAANRANIYIAPGVYTEQPTLDKPHVSVIGLGSSPSDVVISFPGVPNVPPTSYGATFTATQNATGFMANNLTFQNSQPDLNRTQALAAHSRADRTVIKNCRFLGYQDTILLDRKARVYVRDSFITGDTDFIYGDATAVFDRNVIESTDRGYITAANTKKDTANGLIFLDCTLVPGSDRNPPPSGATDPTQLELYDDGTTTVGKTNLVNLGRPWQWDEPNTKSSTIFIRTRMGPHIRAAGWDPWNVTGTSTSNPDPDGGSRYSEFGSMDLGGNPLPLDPDTGMPEGRFEWADPMTAAQAANYTLANIFGGIDSIDFWNIAGTQPEGTGVTYVDNRAAWDPIAQMALLPASVPEPTSVGLLAIGALALLRRFPRSGQRPTEGPRGADGVTGPASARRPALPAVLALALSAAAAATVPAAVWSVDPAADTYISAGPTNGDTNFGSDVELRTRWSTAIDNNRSFLRFALPSDLGPGAIIHSALITVSGTTEINNDTKRIQVTGLVESYDTWSESTLTYNNSGAAGVDTSLTAMNPGFVSGAVTAPFLDSTPNGPLWESGIQRQTFSLRGNGHAFRDFVFADTNDSITLELMPVSTSTYQSDESATAHRPRLMIDYTPAAVPEPGSVAIPACASALIMLRRQDRRRRQKAA